MGIGTSNINTLTGKEIEITEEIENKIQIPSISEM